MTPSISSTPASINLAPLQERLLLLTGNDCSPEEQVTLTNLLLQTLCNSLSAEWVETYLNGIRCGAGDCLQRILEQGQCLRLPIDMPTWSLDTTRPVFRLGEVVQWIPFDETEKALTDWGIVVGKFYGYAPQSLKWMWCYLVLLDPDCLAAQWGMVDTAWENELEHWQD